MSFPFPLSHPLTPLLLLLLCSLLFQHAASQTQSLPLQERAILLKLKQHWGDPQSLSHWSNSSTSNNNASCCGWQEITCEEGSVTGIHLVDANISGTIPLYIRDLWNLSVLKITNNQLDGALPDTFPAKLSLLEISNNKFSGEIPAGISSASNLSVFRARKNQLSGEIPKELESLRHLTELDLSENQFSGEIPANLANEGRLFLNLSSNKLSGRIPTQFENPSYQNSFLNNPKLCSGDPSLHLNSCSGEKNSGLFSSKVAAALGVAGTAIALAFMCASFVIVRICLRRRKPRKTPWKVVSFQRLDFTEEEILANLKKENEIGSGGAGKVYKISVDPDDQMLAIKKIWNNEDPDSKIEKQFESEVEILRKIRHPNIVKLLGCLNIPNWKLLIYEYHENGSLYERLHRGVGAARPAVLEWPKRLRIAEGAAKGLCHMHHQCPKPIIHRDIKSSNILLDSELNAIVADFGLARMLNNPNQSKSMSDIAGSFGYIAPEYARSARVNEKTDVYSFGVVLLELATGKKPLLDGQQQGEKVSLVEWARRPQNISEALDNEIKETSYNYVDEMIRVFKLGIKCTEATPATRPSMKEVLQDLQHCYRPIAYAGQDRIA